MNSHWLIEEKKTKLYKVRTATHFGSGGHTPLLLINGLGSNLELWTPLLDHLGDVTVLAFDVPGIGGSPLPMWPYSMRQMADMVSELITQWGYSQVDVLGVSWGGLLAQQLVHQHPQQCRKLVLAATASGLHPFTAINPVVAWQLSNPRRYYDEAYAKKTAAMLYGGIFRKQPEVAPDLFQYIHFAFHAGYYLQLLSLWGWNSPTWQKKITHPTLVMVGQDDPIVPPFHGHDLCRKIKQAQLVELDCGHLFLLTQPKTSAHYILRFLARG